jgi:O-antigen/teichoic acid export membrane protein
LSDLIAAVVLPSVAMLTPQADRTLLGGVLPIGSYAAYGAAAAAGSGLLVTAGPVVETLYPLLAAAYARGAVDEAARLTLRGARWIALAAAPIVAVMSAESAGVLALWLGRGGLATEGAPVLRWLAPAFALIGLGSLTTTALVAGGAARRGLVIQVTYLVVGCAALVAGAREGGAAAAAGAWALAALAHCIVTFAVLSRIGRWSTATRVDSLRTIAMLVLAPVAALAAVRAVPALPDAGPAVQLLRLGAQVLLALVATALVFALIVRRTPAQPLPPALERPS